MFFDVGQDGLEIRLDVLSTNAKEVDSRRFQRRLSVGIQASPFRVVVDASVDLHRKVVVVAVKVDDEASDRVLTSKLEIPEAAITKPIP
jgi:hypothetical protein